MRTILVSLLAAALVSKAQSLAPLNEKGVPVGALAPEAIAKTRPKPAFDITGTWLHGGGQNNPWQFAPPAGAKLTPAAQVQYDAARKAAAEGKAYHDDIGACWPT